MAAFYYKMITASSQYLFIPVRAGSAQVIVQLICAGKMAREFSVELALSDPPEWWAFYDISAFRGQELAFSVVSGEIPPESAQWLDSAIYQGDEPPGMEDLYAEHLRPQFHYTPRRGWNNDPNGLVYHAGEWHMFYQHNPFGTQWGNMHWGHAVSRDLLHWEELPEALYQRSLLDMSFSGGGLVDTRNSAGFQTGAEPALVFPFTSTGRGECLAYSNDSGRTLLEWEGNPFLAHAGRDPKIIWFEQAQKWVMIIYEELDGGQQRGYAFYDSTDLKQWSRHSFIPGYFECPELFPLAVNGNLADPRWVIHGCTWEKSQSSALIGQFDGMTFTIEQENLHAHYGPRFYAAQAFSNAPGGRVILLGWLQGAHYPGMPFSQGMTVPLELSLRRTQSGLRLCFNPVKELEALREDTVHAETLSAVEANALLARADSELLDVELRLANRPFTLDVRGFPLVYDPQANTLTFDGQTAPLTAGDAIDLRVLVDRSVTEVFANQGLAAFASLTLFEDPRRPLRLEGDVAVEDMKVHRLKGIW